MTKSKELFLENNTWLGKVNSSWSHLLQRRCTPGAHQHPAVFPWSAGFAEVNQTENCPNYGPDFTTESLTLTTSSQVQRHVGGLGNTQTLTWHSRPGNSARLLKCQAVCTGKGSSGLKHNSRSYKRWKILVLEKQKKKQPQKSLKSKTKSLKENPTKKKKKDTNTVCLMSNTWNLTIHFPNFKGFIKWKRQLPFAHKEGIQKLLQAKQPVTSTAIFTKVDLLRFMRSLFVSIEIM